MVNICQAALQDLDAITAIYNDAIINTTATFDTAPKSRKEQSAWFKDHTGKYEILVTEIDNKVIGWASLSKWSDRCAYSDTAECSLYINESFRQRGYGKTLFKAILREAEVARFHTIIARIAEGNNTSIHLCETAGFQHIGTMKEVGRKFGKLLDVHLMQLMLGE